MEHLKLFIVGLLWDALVTVDVIVTADRSPFLAGLTTIILTIISFTVYSKVIEKGELNWKKLMWLAMGSGLGTVLSVWMLM